MESSVSGNVRKAFLKYIEREKMLYYNYKKLLLKKKDSESSFDEEYKIKTTYKNG